MKPSQGGSPRRGDLESAILVGGLLRERRQSLGLTLEKVGEAIRFGTRQILAVEEGRLADLPPQPYARGLVSAYATLVGIAPEELLRVCGPAFSSEASDQRASVFRYPAREQFSWREWTVPFTLAAAVAALVIARAVFAPEPVELSAPSHVPAWLLRPIPEAAPTVDPSPPPGFAAAAPEAATGVRLIVRSEGTTWIEAASDGAEQRRHELGPGQSLEVKAREKLALTLGDAGVTRVSLNGKELGYIGYKGETKSGLLFTAPQPTPGVTAGAAAGD